MVDTTDKNIQNGIKLMGAVFALLILFLATKTVTEIISWDKNEVYPSKTITVSAEGEALATADIATFTFTVSESSDTSETAQNQAEEKTSKALDYLKDNGVEDKDIKTQSYNVFPKYENIAPCYAFDCPPVTNQIIGYEVSQTIQVKVRDIDNAGKILSEITNLEINNVSGLSFVIDDEDVLYDEARKDAIEKAQAKAEVLAQDLDVRLGDIISFNEDFQGGQQPYGGDLYRSEAVSVKAQDVSLPRGENTYTSKVYVTYELK